MLFKLIILILLISLIILFFELLKMHKKQRRADEYITQVTNIVNSVRYGNLSSRIKETDEESHQGLTDSINRMIETLNDREKMILEYQSEMQRRNQLLESVIKSLSDGILIINEKAEILNATPLIEVWFGEKELIGKNVYDFIELSENSDIGCLSSNGVYIKHTPANNFEISSKKLETDEKIRFVLLIKDVTKAHEIETLKEDFVATLTHDLKVPIVAEANIVEFLLEGKFGEISDKQKEALLNMQSSNRELLELVQIVLETYKVKDQGIVLLKEDFELTSFVKSVVDDMQSIANKEGLTINYSVDKEIKINADKTQLLRVIKNIISNAISHSNTKDVIDVKTDNDGKYVNIRVIDYGQGIPKNELPLIFNKYYSATNKFRKIGTGLGLYLAEQIVLSHGGEIVVDSKENERTEFCIRIPV